MIGRSSKPRLEMKMWEAFEGCWQHVNELGGHMVLLTAGGSRLKHHQHACLLFNLHIYGQRHISTERDQNAPEAGHGEP